MAQETGGKLWGLVNNAGVVLADGYVDTGHVRDYAKYLGQTPWLAAVVMTILLGVLVMVVVWLWSWKWK